MCGIAGMMLQPNTVVNAPDLRKMGAVIQHRGPDNTGILVQDQCGFVHTRLSLLDLSEAGNQPMVIGEHTLIYNGEIYNFVELRAELETHGVQFSSTSDTEVILQSLIVHGVHQTLKNIQGMFAFAYYDGKSETVYLCRDRYGIKPMYWTLRDGNLYWASEVKAIAQVISIELDPVQMLYATASGAEWRHEQTLFKGVHALAPGHYLAAKSGQTPQLCPYYNIDEDVDETYFRQLEGMTLDQVTAEFSHLMSQSVRKMLIADAPMGVFLSGGIDSSLLTALAAQTDTQFTLFTSNILGKLSEFQDARLMADHVGMTLYDTPFEPGDLLEYWAETTYHYEAPIVRHISAVPMSRVARLARSHKVKAVLTGEGADELFLGYPFILTKNYAKLVKAPLNGLKALYGIFPRLKSYAAPDESESIDSFLNLLSQGYERQRLREQARSAFHFLPENRFLEEYDSVQMMKEGIISLLHRNDRMGMLASIEARFPFLDEAVVRFGVNLPKKHKIARSSRFHDIMHPFLIDKAVVRKACEPLVPRTIYEKKKLGFPMHGHRDMTVAPGFFRGGYVAQLMGMNDTIEDYMLRMQNPYFVAKLVSVDVFGRQFAMGQSQDAITTRLKDYVSMKLR